MHLRHARELFVHLFPPNQIGVATMIASKEMASTLWLWVAAALVGTLLTACGQAPAAQPAATEASQPQATEAPPAATEPAQSEAPSARTEAPGESEEASGEASAPTEIF